MEIIHSGSRFLLSNRSMSYAIEIPEEGMAQNIYWGAVLERVDDLDGAWSRQCHRHCYTSMAKMQFQEQKHRKKGYWIFLCV